MPRRTPASCCLPTVPWLFVCLPTRMRIAGGWWTTKEMSFVLALPKKCMITTLRERRAKLGNDRSRKERVSMLTIKKRFIVNERQEPVEVILDLATYEKIERLLEDVLFGKVLDKAARERPLPLEEAKRQYARMKKPGQGIISWRNP